MLGPKDPGRRKSFCDSWISKLNDDPGLEDRIFWSDECLIRLGDQIDMHNARIYAESNPQALAEIPNSRLGVMFWVAISSRGIIGPVFVSERLDAVQYRKILEEEFLPRARIMMGRRKFWFQHDGAAAHSAGPINNFLSEVLQERWIGRHGPINWPARSPDLTPLDFGLWGYVRPLILSRNPSTVEDLKESIETVFSRIGRDYCQKLCRSVRDRLQRCYDAEGGHIEQQ